MMKFLGLFLVTTVFAFATSAAQATCSEGGCDPDVNVVATCTALAGTAGNVVSAKLLVITEDNWGAAGPSNSAVQLILRDGTQMNIALVENAAYTLADIKTNYENRQAVIRLPTHPQFDVDGTAYFQAVRVNAADPKHLKINGAFIGNLDNLAFNGEIACSVK